MAGGSGRRLWPLSQERRPKQFLDLIGCGESMLQLTYNRYLNLVPKENVFVISQEMFGGIIADQLPTLSSENVLLVPCDNNTAPAICYASHKLYNLNAKGLVVFAPSDHIILKDLGFFEAIKTAANYGLSNHALITLGITPVRAETGYGYIKCSKDIHEDLFEVESFIEKPSIEAAQHFLKQKNYLWNSGIFIWRLDTIVNAIQQHLPELDSLFSNSNGIYNTPIEKSFIKASYPKAQSISIEYGVLEKASNLISVRADIGWSDLGSWESLHYTSDKDERGNVIKADDSCEISEIDRNIIYISSGNRAVIRGLKDFVVIHEGTDLLICPRSESNGVVKTNHLQQA